jgi:AAA domain
VLPARYATVMHGGGGAAKSVLVLLLGMVVASGAEEWLGLRVHKDGRVLFLDFELDVAEQHRRVRDLAAGLCKPVPERLAYLSALGMNTQEAFEAALRYCRERGVVLLILDSLGPAMLGDVETARDVIRFHNAYVAPFRAEGVTVAIVDHQGKLQAGEAYQNKSSFGSAYKEHLVRSVLQVEAHDRDREAGTLDVRVRHKKASFGPRHEPFDVRLVFGHESIEAQSVKLDDTELAAEGTINADDRIAHALKEGPAYPDELADATGLALGTAKNCLTRLRRVGKVEDTGETRGQTRQVRLASSPSLIYRGSDSDDAKSSPHTEVGEQEISVPAQPLFRDENDRRRRVKELFEAPPRWLQIQASRYLEEGAPERLLKPLAAAVAHDVLGNPRCGEEVVDDIREALKERRGAA